MGTPQHPRTPTAYMQGFLLPSSLCSIAWALWQWHRRPALPRHAALGPWWSPFASLVVVVLQSAVLVSTRVANATAAGLRDRALVEKDIAYYQEYLLFSVSLVVLVARRRQRGPRMDVAVLSAFLGPIFILHVLSGIFKTDDRYDWLWSLAGGTIGSHPTPPGPVLRGPPRSS